jgi:hypothetical protein
MVAPIACSLTPEEMPERVAEIEALGRDALLGSAPGERSFAFRFRPDPDTLARVEAFVAAESQCCAFLGFEIAREDDATILTMTAPPGGEQVLRELAGAFGR